ncbi:Lariat debranching enzyme b [Globisporangium polare]
MKVALVGCTHGELDAIYAHIEELNAAAALGSPSERVKLLLCCGDFESLRNSNDLKCKACPPKYRHMNAFPEYYSGEKRASVLTIFIGGNHEASNSLQELHYGGWVAPHIFYLGAAGVISVGGLRIAGISGIYQAKHYHKGHFERAPYSKDAVKSVYCVREFEIYQLSHLAAGDKQLRRLDAFLSHDWPTHIENHGDLAALLSERPDFRHSIAIGNFGSPGSEHLLKTLRPREWLAGHMHVRFEAHVQHEGEQQTTHFLALSKCWPGKACLEVLDLPSPSDDAQAAGDELRVLMDAEWLAILRATHHLASDSKAPVVLPTAPMVVDIEWVENRLDGVFGSSAELKNKIRGEWMSDFAMTAPPLGQESGAAAEFRMGNPQTDALLDLLELPHAVTTPFAIR